MSAGYLYSVNTTTQTLAIGDTMNVGTAVRRFGCVRGTTTPMINTNGTSTTVSSCGRCPVYFNFNVDIVVAPTEAGTVTVTAYQDGNAITGAVASATTTATAQIVTLPLTFGVRLNTGTTSSNITYVLTGAASSVTNVAQSVEKE